MAAVAKIGKAVLMQHEYVEMRNGGYYVAGTKA